MYKVIQNQIKKKKKNKKMENHTDDLPKKTIEFRNKQNMQIYEKKSIQMK